MPQYKRLEQRAAAAVAGRAGERRQLDDEWLRTGMTADERDDFPLELRQHRRWRWQWRLLGYLFILAVWVGLIGGAAVLWLARDLPRPEDALAASRRPSLTLEDRSGRVFASYGDVVGDAVRLDDLPPYLPAAAVSVEDRRFWSHHGIDLIGVLRAVVVNLRAGHVVQGGSSITQQVAKNLFLSNARTFRRKVQEVLLTLWLEEHFTKREILEIYLNRVYLGAGAWGVDAAAKLYFGVSARRLSLWQAAVIAGLPRAPSRFNPRANPDAAEARGKEVLAAMVDTGAITQAQADQAAAQIDFADPPGTAAWFADWVAQESETLVPEDTDAVLHTTLDTKLQDVATAKLTALLDGPGQAAHVGQGAVVALDAATGAVRAMVGGHQHKAGGYNRAVLARRQAGSTFKPFVYLTALEAGAKPEDHVLDAPLRIGSWSPSNYDGRYRGDVTLEDALAESLNTAAVRVAIQAGGPAAVARTAHKLGIEGKLPDNLTIALGTGDVGVLEMTAAYAPFCNGGLRVTPTGTEFVTTDGQTSAADHTPPARVIAPETAAAMQRLLAGVVAHGSGRAAAVPGRLVVGKTGTTQDYRDAWFVGCVGGMVMGVWLGNDNDTPMQNVSGGTLPTRLFHDIAVEAPKG